MANDYRIKTAQLFGAATTDLALIASSRDTRIWMVIECGFSAGIPLNIVLTDTLDSNVYVTFRLQPGEKVVLSHYGDMPWDGMVLASGVGATATYRGGEVYWERV